MIFSPKLHNQPVTFVFLKPLFTNPPRLPLSRAPADRRHPAENQPPPVLRPRSPTSPDLLVEIHAKAPRHRCRIDPDGPRHRPFDAKPNRIFPSRSTSPLVISRLRSPSTAALCRLRPPPLDDTDFPRHYRRRDPTAGSTPAPPIRRRLVQTTDAEIRPDPSSPTPGFHRRSPSPCCGHLPARTDLTEVPIRPPEAPDQLTWDSPLPSPTSSPVPSSSATVARHHHLRRLRWSLPPLPPSLATPRLVQAPTSQALHREDILPTRAEDFSSPHGSQSSPSAWISEQKFYALGLI